MIAVRSGGRGNVWRRTCVRDGARALGVLILKMSVIATLAKDRERSEKKRTRIGDGGIWRREEKIENMREIEGKIGRGVEKAVKRAVMMSSVEDKRIMVRRKKPGRGSRGWG